MDRSIFIGFEPREAAAFCVALSSIRRHLSEDIPVRGVVLSELQEQGLYTREVEWKKSEIGHPVMWDPISEAPCSTQFAISRFLITQLANSGWALFLDCDMLIRADLVKLFELAEAQVDKAAVCVKHNHVPTNATKMDNQVQTAYSRKNWTSVMLLNLDHPANERLTLKAINTLPGRDLHRFFWLYDDEIGEVGPEWNFLVGHTDPKEVPDPCIVHHTDGIPAMFGYENVPFADEWRAELDRFGTLSMF